MKSGAYFFIDVGDDVSVCSSLFAANLFANAIREDVYFCAPAEFRLKDENFPRINLITPDEAGGMAPLSKMVVDFTEPGKGLSKSALMFTRSEKMHMAKFQCSGDNVLLQKTDFITACTDVGELYKTMCVRNVSPVLTYSPAMSAMLNLSGIPTIELCYKFKKPGTFLPGSLVIAGDTFTLLNKEEVAMIFEFYEMGRVEEVFQNRAVIEADWDLMYHKMDQSRTTIVSKKYPVTPAESFMDHFFKGFLSPVTQRTFSIDHLLQISNKMDTIDLEMTLEFLRKTLRLCIEDVEDYDSGSFDAPYWNLVRPYLDCRRKGLGSKLRKSLEQALIGLDLFSKILDRNRKVMSMH
jgi:hypothetical protein